jgi:hypothetical protein
MAGVVLAIALYTLALLPYGSFAAVHAKDRLIRKVRKESDEPLRADRKEMQIGSTGDLRLMRSGRKHMPQAVLEADNKKSGSNQSHPTESTLANIDYCRDYFFTGALGGDTCLQAKLVDEAQCLYVDQQSGNDQTNTPGKPLDHTFVIEDQKKQRQHPQGCFQHPCPNTDDPEKMCYFYNPVPQRLDAPDIVKVDIEKDDAPICVQPKYFITKEGADCPPDFIPAATETITINEGPGRPGKHFHREAEVNRCRAVATCLDIVAGGGFPYQKFSHFRMSKPKANANTIYPQGCFLMADTGDKGIEKAYFNAFPSPYNLVPPNVHKPGKRICIHRDASINDVPGGPRSLRERLLALRKSPTGSRTEERSRRHRRKDRGRNDREGNDHCGNHHDGNYHSGNDRDGKDHGDTSFSV